VEESVNRVRRQPGFCQCGAAGSGDNGTTLTLAPGAGYVEYARSHDDPTYWDLARIAPLACASERHDAD